MRIHALLSWYQEPVSWLAELVSSMGRVGVDHVVALDGAYFLYPRGQRASEGDQADVIRRTAVGAGMGATVAVPQMPWMANEVEKRDRLFSLAYGLAEPGDWFWVCDGDEVIETAPSLRSRLLDLEEDVARVTLRVQQDPQGESEYHPIPKLFRVKEGGPPRVINRHDRYVGPDGEQLWVAGDDGQEVVPWADLLDVEVLHRLHQRPAYRVLQRAAYYLKRDELEVEH